MDVSARRNDTLASIAQRTGVPVPDLVRANPQIKDVNRLEPGQTVHVPGWDGQSSFEVGKANAGPLVAGVVGSQAALGAAPEAKCRLETRRVYGEIQAALDAAQQRIANLDGQRQALSEGVAAKQAEIDAHLSAKPKGPLGKESPWVMKMQELQQQKSALDSQRSAVASQLATEQSAVLEVRGVKFPATSTGAGPVVATVVDNLTGKVFHGMNDPDGLPPENLHPLLRERLANQDAARTHPSNAGSHAEVYALNEALWARDALLKKSGQQLKSSDLSSFTLDTAWLKGDASKAGGMSAGSQAELCANCQHLAKGVNNLPGDSPRDYAKVEGLPEAKPPPSRWHNRTVDAAKSGAKSGAAAGLLFGGIEALKSGKLDANTVGDIALSTAVGAGTGALGGVVEETATRAINRAAGKAIERGASSVASRLMSAEAAGGAAMSARVIAGRLGGAGIAGGVINAGFSAVDQIGAYQRGEVTASQAIGTVTGEAAVGVGAGVAGAAAGAAIGSVIPVAGTIVGGVIGFGVGVAAGFLADKGLRSVGVDKAIAQGVTAVIDGAGSAMSGAVDSLKHAFGW